MLETQTDNTSLNINGKEQKANMEILMPNLNGTNVDCGSLLGPVMLG